jgi:hypothetical protein
MSDGVDELVSYHGELVFEAVEATAGKRLLVADGTPNALLLFGNKLDRVGHIGSFTIWTVFPACIRLVNPGWVRATGGGGAGFRTAAPPKIDQVVFRWATTIAAGYKRGETETATKGFIEVQQTTDVTD